MTGNGSGIESLKPGDHLCFIYETESEHRAVVTPFLRHGLERGEKVVYIADVHTAESILDYLRDSGTDVESYLSSRQLVILEKDEAYTKDGIFRPDRMIDLLRRETARALDEGYSALRVTGEMTWALKETPGSERLIEYETRLNEFFPGSQCLAICQYDKNRFEPAVLLDVLRSHPKAVIGTTVYDNFYYIPPEELTDLDLSQVKLRHWLKNLSGRKRIEEELRASHKFLKTTYDAIPDAIIATDMDFNIVSCNKSVQRILGYSPEELIGQNYSLFVSEGMMLEPGQKERQAQLFEKGYLESDDYHFKRRDGKVFLARFSVALLRDDAGNPAGLIGTFRDITERKKSEEALKESEEKFRTLFDNASDAIFIHDLKGRFLEVNQVACDRLGYTKKEFLHMTPTDIDSPEYAPLVAQRIEKLVERGHLFVETSHVCRDGSVIPVELSSKIVEFSGNPAILSIARDISDRKRTEKLQASIYKISEAAHSAKSLNDLFQSIHQIITELMPAENFYIALYDAESDSLSFPYFVDECDEKPARKTLGKGLTEYILRTGQPLLVPPEVFEELVRKREVETMGTPAVDWLGVPLKTAEKTIGVLAVQTYSKDVRYREEHKDILMFVSEQVATAVERTRMQNALRSSEENFRNLFRLTSDAIVIQDRDGRFVDLNRSAERLFGYKKEELLGHPEIQLADREKTDRKVADDLIEKAFAGESGRFEWWGKKKDGTSFPEEIVLNRTLYDGEEVIFVTIRDITERKRAEEERERLNLELGQKNKELEQMIYVASHDLRSPLVNIQGFSAELEQALKDVRSVLQSEEVSTRVRNRLSGVVKEDIPEALDYILSSTSKMESLIRGLLRLSRLGRVALKIEKLDMNRMMADIAKGLEFQAKEVGATVEIKKLPSCRGDRVQINQVFSNLLDNALKYLNPDREGSIKISGKKQRRQSVYCVEDNGIGIPKDSREHIYEIFRQLNPDESKGEGLGLTIVRRILDRHKGKVWVESKPGTGSRFYVSLPR